MFRLIIAAGFALLASVPSSALAQDLAVIVSNLNYRSQHDLPSGQGVDRMERALADAGFRIVKMQNMPQADALRRLDRVRETGTTGRMS